MGSSVTVDRHEELPFPVECTEDNNLSSQTVGQQEVLMFPVQCTEPNDPALLNVNIPRDTAVVTTICVDCLRDFARLLAVNVRH